jgi:hypothetical protein
MAISQTPISFKQGTSFGATCVYTQETGGPADLTGITITTAFRDAGYNYYPFVVDLVNPTTFTVTYPFNTINWVPGTGYWDIQFKYGEGSIFYTTSISINVIPCITGSYQNNSMVYG